MSDGTSALLFATFFEHLARNPNHENVKLAHKLWRQTRDYDFSSYQMNAEAALVKLGLARRGVDPEYPEEGETWVYGPSDDEQAPQSNLIAQALAAYAEAERHLHNLFGYEQQYRVFPIEDHTECPWMEIGGRIARFDTDVTVNETEIRQGTRMFTGSIYTQRHLDKWVYRTETHTMALIDTHCDLNVLFMVFDNAREVTDPALKEFFGEVLVMKRIFAKGPAKLIAEDYSFVAFVDVDCEDPPETIIWTGRCYSFYAMTVPHGSPEPLVYRRSL